MTQQDTKNTQESRGAFVPALLGFVAGGLVGAVTALLYAPQSGEKTRERIREHVTDMSSKASEVGDRTREAFEEAKDRVLNAYESAVEKTSSAIESAKEKIVRKKEDEV